MKLTFIDKIGSVGTFLTALACPVCWPLFASLGGALGLGVLAPYEGVFMNYVFPGFVISALAGALLSYRYHRSRSVLAVGVLSGLMVLYGFYVGWQLAFMYAGIFGLLLSSALSYFVNRNKAQLCQK